MEEVPCDIRSRCLRSRYDFSWKVFAFSVVSGAKHVYYCLDLDLWNNKHISYKLIQYAFQKLLSYTYGQNCQKKTSLATPFRLLVSPTIFSVSMHYHYIYVLQISDLLLPHRTCFAIPVTVRLLNKDRFTGLKFSMCLKKEIDVIWYHNVDPSGHPRKTRKLINIFQNSGRPQLGEFKAIHSTIIFAFDLQNHDLHRFKQSIEVTIHH